MCRNTFFGEPQRFDLYNNSKAREAVEKAGKTLDPPAVASRMADWLYSKRMSIRAAHPEMPFGTRAELQRWRNRCAKLLTTVMGADAIPRIEQARGRKFMGTEVARLREIGANLNLRDDDAVWSILAALEYQRTFNEALPEKISYASKEILQGMTAAAAKEAATAQARLISSVVEQA